MGNSNLNGEHGGSNHDEEESQEIDEILKALEDDDSDDEDFEDEKNGEDGENILAAIKAATKKDFKSVDDLVKSLKEGDKAHAILGQLKKKQKENEDKGDDKNDKKEDISPENAKLSESVLEEILIARYPEAQFVLDELNEAATLSGKTKIEIYKNSKFLQTQASVLSRKASNSLKMKKPADKSTASADGDDEFKKKFGGWKPPVV